MLELCRRAFGWIPKAARELPGAVRVREEDKTQILIVRGLRGLALAGEPLLWFHAANELELKGPAGIAVAKRRRMMGVIPGAADLWIFVAGVPLALEIKAGDGRQSEAQKEFQEWCELHGIAYQLVRSADEGLAIVTRLLLERKHTLSEGQRNGSNRGNPREMAAGV